MKKTQLKPHGLKQSKASTTYLVIYNMASLLAWGTVLYHLVNVLVLYRGSTHRVFFKLEAVVKYTQTAAVIEILNCALGLVKASTATTAIQVASRLLLVWCICHNFPKFIEPEIGYATMIFAWSLTEVIRYGYYVLSLLKIEFYPLLWMR